ncbi:MAG: hypothetical protein ABSF44_09635 [Candidatus Bathyarchaeia archaeon]|jgi:hypothetical protein
MNDDPLNQAKPIVLKTGGEVAGLYKKMQRDASNTIVVLEQTEANLIKILFLRGSNDERIVHDALLCVKHNVKISIKKPRDPGEPIQVQRFHNRKTKYSPTKTITLKTGEEIFCFYKEQQKTDECVTLVLEQTEGNIVQLPFAKGSVEAGIVRDTLSHVKYNVKIGILKVNDEKKPIQVRIIPNLSTKNYSIYSDKNMVKRLDPFCDPSIINPRKRISNAISRILDIVENKQIIAVVLNEGSLQCNKMQSIGKTDGFYCSHIGGPISRSFCLEKCVVATAFQKILEGGN